MFTHRRSDRRSSRRGVVTESLECRQLSAAVIAPIVDYNINPARLGLYDSVQLNDEVVVFSAYTLEYGSELWRTDGTADGTYRLTDRNAGPQDSEPAKLTRVGDVVYFSMRPSTNASQGVELWKTDGTLVGTQRVNAFSGEPSSITHMVPSSDSQLNFIRNGEVWQTDGTGSRNAERNILQLGWPGSLRTCSSFRMPWVAVPCTSPCWTVSGMKPDSCGTTWLRIPGPF